MNILLVGAGQLGSRHLQALAETEGVKAVYVLDPNPSARSRVESRWEEMGGHDTKRLFFSTDLAMPSEVTFAAAIIATPSKSRLQWLDKILAGGIIRVLCEKVLFQSVSEYRHALNLVGLPP